MYVAIPLISSPLRVPLLSPRQVHNYLRTWRPSVTNLADFVKSVMKLTSLHQDWPQVAGLPGDYRPPEAASRKTNLIAYQVGTAPVWCSPAGL